MFQFCQLSAGGSLGKSTVMATKPPIETRKNKTTKQLELFVLIKEKLTSQLTGLEACIMPRNRKHLAFVTLTI